jgi:hypothetical protein
VGAGNALASTFSRDTHAARESSTGTHTRDVASDDSGRDGSEARGERTGKEKDRSPAQGVADASTGGDAFAATDAFFADLGKKGRSLWGRLPGC